MRLAQEEETVASHEVLDFPSMLREKGRKLYDAQLTDLDARHMAALAVAGNAQALREEADCLLELMACAFNMGAETGWLERGVLVRCRYTKLPGAQIYRASLSLYVGSQYSPAQLNERFGATLFVEPGELGKTLSEWAKVH